MHETAANVAKTLPGLAGGSVAWAAQITSGALFGAISYHYYGRFPEISGIAMAALTVKVINAGWGSCSPARFCCAPPAGPRPEAGGLGRVDRIWNCRIGCGGLSALVFLSVGG